MPNFSVAISGNYFTFIFSENNFIREERLDVTTRGCCQTSPLPFLAITLLLSFPKTISSVKSDLTSRQQGAAKLLRCHFWQLLYFYLFRKQFHRWRATWRHDNRVLPNFSVAISGNYFTFIFSENNFIGEERLDVTTTGCCQTSPLPFLAITLLLSFPKTISSVKSDLTSRQQGAAKLLRCHFWQLLYFYLFRKHFHPWRATWRHDNRVLPNSSVAISGNYFTFIFSENNFIGEERLDVTTTGCCQTSPLPFLAITLLLTFPKTISSVKSDLTSRQQGAAKLLRCHCWQLLYCYLFRKQFHPWRANWRHDNRVLPNFSVAISGNYFTFIFSENNFIREERLDVTTTGCCQTSPLPFPAITLLLSFPKTISSVKSDLTSRQQGAAKLLAAISGLYFTFIFSENNFIREERLDVTTTGCWKTSPLPFLSINLLLSFPKTISSVKSDLTSQQLGAAKLLRCHFWQLLYFYLFRKQFHPWRATWRHNNRVLPNFSVAISGNYFTFIFPENNFIREERLDVTTTGCCQTSPLPFPAITLLLSFPKTISSVKSDLTSRQQGAAKLLAAISGLYFTFIFSENNFIREERLDVTTTGCWKTSPLPFLSITLLLSFPKTISSVKSDLTSRQQGAAKLLHCHFWQLLYFYLFRKQFHPWIATWRHDNRVLKNFYVAISGNYFTLIFSENNFLREERLDVTTTGCCQTSPLPFLAITLLLSLPKTISSVKSDLTSRQQGAAKLLRCHFWQLLFFYLFRKQFHPWRATWRHDNRVLPNFSVAISGNYFTFIFSENNFIREERPDVTTTGCCQTPPLPFLAITLLLSFPKTISSVKSDLTSRQQGAAKLLRCHFWQLHYF